MTNRNRKANFFVKYERRISYWLSQHNLHPGPYMDTALQTFKTASSGALKFLGGILSNHWPKLVGFAVNAYMWGMATVLYGMSKLMYHDFYHDPTPENLAHARAIPMDEAFLMTSTFSKSCAAFPEKCKEVTGEMDSVIKWVPLLAAGTTLLFCYGDKLRNAARRISGGDKPQVPNNMRKAM